MDIFELVYKLVAMTREERIKYENMDIGDKTWRLINIGKRQGLTEIIKLIVADLSTVDSEEVENEAGSDETAGE